MKKILSTYLKGLKGKPLTVIALLLSISVFLFLYFNMMASIYSDNVENSYMPGTIDSPTDGEVISGTVVTVDVTLPSSANDGSYWYYLDSSSITVFSDDNSWSEDVNEGVSVLLPSYETTYHIKLVINIYAENERGQIITTYSAINTYYSSFSTPIGPTVPTGSLSTGTVSATRVLGQPITVIATWSGEDVNGDVSRVYLELITVSSGTVWFSDYVYDGSAVTDISGTTDVVIGETTAGEYSYNAWIVITDSGGRKVTVPATIFTITWVEEIITTTTPTTSPYIPPENGGASAPSFEISLVFLIFIVILGKLKRRKQKNVR